MNENNEQEVVEELTASLTDFIVESIGGISLDATYEALQLLGVHDGEELNLPVSFENDSFAGELIAEAIMTRPEFRDVLSALGTLLVKRIKIGE